MSLSHPCRCTCTLIIVYTVQCTNIIPNPRRCSTREMKPIFTAKRNYSRIHAAARFISHWYIHIHICYVQYKCIIWQRPIPLSHTTHNIQSAAVSHRYYFFAKNLLDVSVSMSKLYFLFCQFCFCREKKNYCMAHVWYITIHYIYNIQIHTFRVVWRIQFWAYLHKFMYALSSPQINKLRKKAFHDTLIRVRNVRIKGGVCIIPSKIYVYTSKSLHYVSSNAQPSGSIITRNFKFILIERFKWTMCRLQSPVKLHNFFLLLLWTKSLCEMEAKKIVHWKQLDFVRIKYKLGWMTKFTFEIGRKHRDCLITFTIQNSCEKKYFHLESNLPYNTVVYTLSTVGFNRL